MKKTSAFAILSGLFAVSCTSQNKSSLLDDSIRGVGAFSNLNLSAEDLKKAALLRFDVNDVSFLLPKLDSDDEFLAELPMLTKFKPSESYLTQVMKFFNIELNFKLLNPVTGKEEKVGGPTDTLEDVLAQASESFRVVAFRFDDCAPGAANDDGKTQKLNVLKVANPGENRKVELAEGVFLKCVPQIRLVAQSGQSEDNGIHLIFSLVKSPETFSKDFALNAHEPEEVIVNQVIKDLQILKLKSTKSTSGEPLGVHPGFAALESRKEYIGLVNSFFDHYLQPKYLTNLAFLSTNAFDGGDAWSMAGASHSASNPDDLRLAPILANSETPLSLHFGVGENFKPSLESIKTVRSGRGRSGETEENNGFPIPGLTIDQSSVTNLSGLLDPHTSSILSTDCFSCHKATTLLGEVLHDKEQRNRAFTSEINKQLFTGKLYVAPEGITAFPAPGQAQLDEDNFHNFGYFNGIPSVSLRTVTESAAVAASLNKRVFGNAKGPGQNCKAKTSADILKSILERDGKELNTDTLFKACTLSTF